MLLCLGAPLVAGCLEAPGVGKAAAPGQAKGMARGIMGSSTTNEEMEVKLKLLKQLLDGEISVIDLTKKFEKQVADLDEATRKKRLEGLKEAFDILPPAIRNGQGMPPGPDRDMVLARLYYSERRFVEAAIELSKILDQKSDYPEARNLLARCFFFLGNPDRTILELNERLRELDAVRKVRPLNEKERFEEVDALYLIGAAVLESPGTSKQNLQLGERAWVEYLKKAPGSPQKQQVLDGLEEIRAGIRGEGRLARTEVVRSAAAMGGGQSATGGGGSFQGGGMGPAAKKADRLKKLPKDASPYERAIAGGLDALDMRDAVRGEQLAGEAEKLQPGDPMAQTIRARAYVLTGRTEEALRLFGEIIKRNPTFWPAWHYNGVAHLMSGDPRRAAESWQTIMDKAPDYAKRHNLDRRLQIAKRMAK